MTDARSRAEDAVRAFAAEQNLALDTGPRDGELVLVLPGEKKLKTVCSIVLAEREASLSAFVIRHPDENHAEFFRYLLRRNLRSPGLAYATDVNDDVYVVARLPIEAVTDDALDRLFGVVLESADAAFNELLVLGFLTSMRREWAWRVARGESLRNLEAFRDVLAGSEDDPTYHVEPLAESAPEGAVSDPEGILRAAVPAATASPATTADEPFSSRPGQSQRN